MLVIEYGASWTFIHRRKASEWMANRHKPHKAIMVRADGSTDVIDIHDVPAVPGRRVPMDRVPADIAAKLKELHA